MIKFHSVGLINKKKIKKKTHSVGVVKFHVSKELKKKRKEKKRFVLELQEKRVKRGVGDGKWGLLYKCWCMYSI